MKEKLNKLVGFAKTVKGKARTVAMTAVASCIMAMSAFAADTEGTSSLASVVSAEMLSGVLDEVIALLPVVIPVTIGFIALRKGIAFIKSALKSA